MIGVVAERLYWMTGEAFDGICGHYADPPRIPPLGEQTKHGATWEVMLPGLAPKVIARSADSAVCHDQEVRTQKRRQYFCRACCLEIRATADVKRIVS